MNAEELFNLNGNFTSSPLLATARRLHILFSRAGMPYTIIGGMAVVRNGGYRTTHDIDILTTRKGWQCIREIEQDEFETGMDYAKDQANQICVDILFQGDDWDMVFPMPDPETVSEYDPELKAVFLDLLHIIELKTAVFISKRDAEGIELAAKDLADVVELVRKNREKINGDFISKVHSGVKEEFQRIADKILKKE